MRERARTRERGDRRSNGNGVAGARQRENSDNEDVAEERYLRALQVGGAELTVQEQQSIESRYSEYEQLAARAFEVFGTEIEATRWLSSQSHDFAGLTPLQDLIKQGPDHALAVLGKIEHGVFF
jgi:uncharacterized protein (DUF2384 family)